MMERWNIHFDNPWWLLGLILIPMLVAFYVLLKHKQTPDVSFNTKHLPQKLPKSFRQKTWHLPFVLRMLTIALLVLAMARPRGHIGYQDIETEGIDIVLSIDVSLSMLAQDFSPDRLEASKKIAGEFITQRPDDRVGLVTFAGESFTLCPTTTDQAILLNLLSSIKPGMLPDGTAIGMGLATAVSRLKESLAKSKVIILLTDGVNNSGNISPLTAAEIARTYGIRVYTIGVGKRGKARSPIGYDPSGNYVYDYIDVNIDEDVLKEMATITGGKYFRAENEKALRSIYQEIDQLEKTIVEVREYEKKPDKFWPFVLVAAIIFLIELVLRWFVYRSIP